MEFFANKVFLYLTKKNTNLVSYRRIYIAHVNKSFKNKFKVSRPLIRVCIYLSHCCLLFFSSFLI